MAFIKRADGEITHVFAADEHKFEDEKTREEMRKAAEAKKAQLKQAEAEK